MPVGVESLAVMAEPSEVGLAARVPALLADIPAAGMCAVIHRADVPASAAVTPAGLLAAVVATVVMGIDIAGKPLVGHLISVGRRSRQWR
jgi:hypothetical protein